MCAGSSVTLTGLAVTAKTLLYFVNTEIHSYIIKQVRGLSLSSTPVHLISLDKGAWDGFIHLMNTLLEVFQQTQSGLFSSIHHTVRKGPFASVHLVYCQRISCMKCTQSKRILAMSWLKEHSNSKISSFEENIFYIIQELQIFKIFVTPMLCQQFDSWGRTALLRRAFKKPLNSLGHLFLL